MSASEVVIVAAARTPFGKFGGSLRGFDAIDLSALVMKEVINRAQISPEVVDEVYWGVGDTASVKDVYTPVVARQALLKAGLPPETPSCSLDKACVSGTSAALLAMRAIRLGEAQAVLAGGVTTFSQMPLVVRNLRFQGHRLGPVTMEDPLFELGYKDYNPVAVDAGEVALEHSITREEQDKWALRSHQLYGAAHAEGKFKDEMMALEIKEKGKEPFVLEIDEQYRPNVSLEKLAQLATIYGSPTCTAGNSPGLNDGAAALLLMSASRASELGLRPLGIMVDAVSVALKPRLLAEGPAAAIKRCLERSGLSLSDMALIEINEAFAAVPLVSSHILGGGKETEVAEIRRRLNVNGGAIAIGHPNTASGARLMMTLIYELRRRGGGYGIAAICGGLAQGDAVLVKVD